MLNLSLLPYLPVCLSIYQYRLVDIYFVFLVIIILLYFLVQIVVALASGSPSRYLCVSHAHIIFFFVCKFLALPDFPALQDVPGSLCPSLMSYYSSFLWEELFPLIRNTVLEPKVWVLGVIITTVMSLLPADRVRRYRCT